jgi:hypothetical protein
MLKKQDIIKPLTYSILKLEKLNKQLNPNNSNNIINNQLIFQLKEINLNSTIKNQKRTPLLHQPHLFPEQHIKLSS